MTDIIVATIKNAWHNYVMQRNLHSLCLIAQKYKEYKMIKTKYPNNFEPYETALLESIDNIPCYNNPEIRRLRKDLIRFID
jgi:hypothetical protein